MSLDDPRYSVGGNNYQPALDRSSKDSTPAAAVAKFHEKADTDTSAEALHHTLGFKHDQAAAGDHNHQKGKGYKPPLTGVAITGSRASGAALISVIDALEKLGATDSTVA